ncbi:MAG: adenylate/guanylate cyclase domain-containing protein, partial [Pseudomonadota bacterium]
MAYPERSIVTVLVVDAVSSTDRIAGVDPDDAQRMVDDVLAHIRNAVETAGGLLVSFAGDGGVAVFGWPDSLEDHADRACEAAWNIQHQTVDGVPVLDPSNNIVQFRVGVHSGLVGLRHLELERGSQLDLVGGTVHLAARLEKAAKPGEILISAETRELCRSVFQQRERADLPILEEIGSRVVEVQSSPVRRDSGNRLPSYTHKMVGRIAQREEIYKMLFEAADPGTSIAIVGEPGIGKSRLASAIVEDARNQEAVDQVLIFRGDIQRRSSPFALLRTLILNALQLGEAASHETISEAFNEAGIKDIAPLLPGIFMFWQGDPSERGTKTDLSIKQTAQMLIDALFHLVKDRATLLLVEDLHLVDPESLVCLELMKSRPPQQKISVLVTGRPEAAYDARQVADTVFRLDPLPREDMRKLAEELWSERVPPKQYLDTALEQADGIPFVLEQFACALETDRIDTDPTVPQSVQSLIHARINRLPSHVKYCAQGLSILGEEVELGFAQQVLDLDETQLREALTELEKLAITHPANSTFVRFRHNIIASACAITVPRSRRVEIHRAAIGSIKDSFSDLGGQYERLAFHAEEAGDDEAALEFLYFACSRASKSAAGKSLLLNFERALRCVDRLGEKAEPTFVKLVQMVCAPLLQHGEFSQMRNHLARAMEFARKYGDQNRICAALCQLGTVHWFDGRYLDGIELAEQALVIAQDIDSLPHRYSAQHLLSVLHHGIGDLERAIELQDELCTVLSGDLETARLGSAGIPAATSRAFMGWFLTEVGRFEESHEYVMASLDISRRCGSSYSEGIALHAVGRNHLMAGRNEEAIEYLEAAHSLVEQYGYDAPKPHVTGLLASAMARGNRADEALELAEDCFDKALHLRTGRMELFYLYSGYAEALFRSGAVERSFPAVDQAIE